MEERYGESKAVKCIPTIRAYNLFRKREREALEKSRKLLESSTTRDTKHT